MQFKGHSRPASSLKSKRRAKDNSAIGRADTTPETARDVLLHEAKHLFALKGLSGTTIRDIARAAKMNSAQISYYFTNKEGLYRACLADIAKGRISSAEEFLTPPTSKEEFKLRLRLFVENLFKYFLENRDTGLIIIRESDRIHSPAQDIFKAYFSRLYELLNEFFLTSHKLGFSKHGADPLVTTSIFFGAVMNELRLDHIKEGLFGRSIRNTTERKKITDHLVELFSA